jgi:hypothetical protein
MGYSDTGLVDFNSILEQTKQENLFSASYVVVMLLVLNMTFNVKLFNLDNITVPVPSNDLDFLRHMLWISFVFSEIS